MCPAAYEDIDAARIPVASGPGWQAKVVAGTLQPAAAEATAAAVGSITDPVTGPVTGVSTRPIFFDIMLGPDGCFEHPLPAGHATFVYVYEGTLQALADSSLPQQALLRRQGGVFGDGEGLRVASGVAGARFLLLAAAPIGEPIVQYGPFVMNTREEIDLAVRDYQAGRLVGSGSST